MGKNILLKIMEKIYKIRVYHTHKKWGGHLINIGGKKKDVYGVYTVLDCIPDNACVVSAGLGTDTNFEEDILNKYKNANIYAFDPTPKSIEFVKNVKHLDENERFHFFPYGISKEDGRMRFYLPIDNTAVSCSSIRNMYSSKKYIEVETKSFESVLKLSSMNKIDILKLDIEGTEFAVIEDILNSGIEITQICLEIHPLYFENPYLTTKSFMKKLFESNYKISYITRKGLGNELSFIKI